MPGDIADDVDILSQLDRDIAVDGVVQSLLNPQVHRDRARHQIGLADAGKVELGDRGSGAGKGVGVSGIPCHFQGEGRGRIRGVKGNRRSGQGI